jgi:hypothetical protein
MYLCVTGHVFVCYRSCICVLQVMYLCVTGHVFVCYRSCICVLQVMYLCFTGHVFVCYWSCICVLQVSILPLSTILLLNFGTVPAVWYFYFYFFFFYSINRDCCQWIYWFISSLYTFPCKEKISCNICSSVIFLQIMSLPRGKNGAFSFFNFCYAIKESLRIYWLRNKSWKPECVGSFNMDGRILVFHPEPEARDKIY